MTILSHFVTYCPLQWKLLLVPWFLYKSGMSLFHVRTMTGMTIVLEICLHAWCMFYYVIQSLVPPLARYFSLCECVIDSLPSIYVALRFT